MALPINVEDLIHQRKVERTRIEYKADWNPEQKPRAVLLQDRRYRKVWLGWSLLRNIDDSIKHLFLNRKLNISSFIFWNVIAELSTFKGVRFFQKPIIFNNEIDKLFAEKEADIMKI